MKRVLDQSKCKSCGAILYEAKGAKRSPCPACGETVRIVEGKCLDTVVCYDHMRMKGKHGGKGEPFFDSQVGASFFYKTQKWYHLERIIEKDNDLYVEIITDPKTKEIIRKIEEPLSEHQGHGSAKYKKT